MQDTGNKRARRRPSSFLLSMAAVLSAPASTVEAFATPDRPVLRVAAPLHDFGEVEEGAVLRHSFAVTNAGTVPLEIRSADSPCACVEVVDRPRQIVPGSFGRVTVAFDTRDHPGPHEKTITIVSNDPEWPTSHLRFRAQVLPLVEFEPAITQIEAFVGEIAVQEVWLSGSLAGTVRPRVVAIEAPWIVSIRVVEKATMQGKRQGLRIALHTAAVGRGSIRVQVATGLTRRPNIEHRIIWSVKGNIETPRHVHLDLSHGKERVITIGSRRGDFRLRDVRVLNGPFSVIQVGEQSAGIYSFKVRTSLTAPPPAFVSGKLVIESNDPSEPSKVISVSLAPATPVP
jgi:hypothetical protein